MTTEQLTRPREALTALEKRLFADDGPLLELVDDQLVAKPMSALSTWLLPHLAFELIGYMRARQLGVSFSEQLFRVPRAQDQRRTRRPDLAVMLNDRDDIPAANPGIIEAAPDFLIEIISPSDTGENIETKIEDYVAAGVSLAWYVFPESRVLRLHRADGTHDRYSGALTLDGRDVLPGFSVDLSALLQTAPFVVPEPAGDK